MAMKEFAAPLFEVEHGEIAVDISQTPFFYNDKGSPSYHKALPEGAELLQPAPIDAKLARGHRCKVDGVISVKETPPYGVETQLDFAGDDVVFEPLWATREVAAAFGITLVEPNQGLVITSPVNKLTQVAFEYGVFAGHWSPYQDTGAELLSVVCSDFEHHDFPHVFASTDPHKPLVISVARYWPHKKEIRLADLWVPQGNALYIPPQIVLPDAECIDLHNNRNSARACWGHLGQNSVKTHTLLQNQGGYFYWFWNPKPTVHSAVKA